ncbi:N-acetylmuramoyl-L-alanine amidase, partial [Clostridium sp. Ade.TY]|uniref:N-acetylmuramoyl-L-alanine amidase family protein n=1 Tax=Clostridium sp. Ade.TY TaxID=1391647 RepID=UPI00046451E1
MKSKKLKMIIKTTLIMLAISVSPLYGKVAFADNISNLEQQFLLVTDGYNSDEIVVENGISLKFGETLNLSKYKNAKMSNSNIISISETGIVTPKKEGTVYLSKKIGNKIHVMEIYVSSNNKSDYFTRSSKEVDRNYYKVFIDPGHGGHDDGASSFGLKEDELNLKIGLKIQKKLEAKGIEVKMSRTSDEYLSLDERAKMANEYGADIFVSNHINSFEKDSAYGIETYYHRDKSPHKPLSDNIQENAIKETGAFNRGVKNANFAVLRESEMTSSLFEAGFISNKVESDKLKDDKYQEKIANAIVDGIDKYLKDNIKLNGNTTKPDTKPEEKPNENPNDKPETTVKKGIVTASSLNVR